MLHLKGSTGKEYNKNIYRIHVFSYEKKVTVVFSFAHNKLFYLHLHTCKE